MLIAFSLCPENISILKLLGDFASLHVYEVPLQNTRRELVQKFSHNRNSDPKAWWLGRAVVDLNKTFPSLYYHIVTFIMPNVITLSTLSLDLHGRQTHRQTDIQTHTQILCYIKQIRQVGYWHQRADERHGNPPPR